MYIMNGLSLFSLSTTIKSTKIIAPCTSIVTEIQNNTLHVQVRIKLYKAYHAGRTAISGVKFHEHKRPFTRS
jgi:hypothetical protein